MMSTFMRDTETISMGAALSVVLIGPNEERRRTIAKAFSGPQSRIGREFSEYPTIDDLGQVLDDDDHDVVLVDLDPDPEAALDVIENVCASNGSLTVIVYSARTDPELLVRCMRAGAREFLTEPVLPNAVTEALVRASVRRDEVRRVKKTLGKLYVFAGAKGGSGVTTIASNFALSLAKDCGARVALLDLDLHLGDAALSLGITSKFSTADALENTHRLDSDFLAAMLTKHASGLCVLPAPDSVSSHSPTRHAVERLLRVAREDFGNVVVDSGANPADVCLALFDAATTVYLVTQVSLPELRNANRLITRYFSGGDQAKLEIVLNRFAARSAEIDEAAVTKALTRPAKWKIPNEYAAARRAQNTGTAVVLEDSPLGRAIREMAKAASGQMNLQEKKKRFGLFR